MPTKESDLRALVRDSYDRIAERYLGWRLVQHREGVRPWVSILTRHLSPGSRVLDLGCGAGIPLTKSLAATFEVTGLDISSRQIELARHNVPDARFINADMMTHHFQSRSFDAVVASYSLFHVPRAQHATLMRKIAVWLQPGGFLLANFGIGNIEVDYDEDWLGAPMFWSSFDVDGERAAVAAAGFELDIDRIEIEKEDGKPHRSLLILARTRR